MITAIKNTLRRLSGKIYIFNPWKWYLPLLEGLSIEFNRISDFKDQVLSSTVPNSNLPSFSLDDYNKKYGIPDFLATTDEENICLIMERADLNGFPGYEWLEEQLHIAGFILYVHENTPLTTSVRQYNTSQYGPSIQYGLTARFIDPDTIPGILVVGSPPGGAGRIFLHQYGGVQYGTTGLQYGTKDPNSLNPQPIIYIRTDASKYWGFYFTLSPFPDRVAIDESEFLSYDSNALNYLKNLIIDLKLQRNWCILQAKEI